MASNTPTLGGYDLKFVNEPPDSLVCLICTFVARDPQQMDCCGRVYCQLCLAEYKKHSNNCPQCRGNGNIFLDTRGAREIKALNVKCNNINNGCQWTGELRGLEEHLQQCGFLLVPCTNQCKQGAEFTKLYRKDLDDHLTSKCPRRRFRCPHCFQFGEHNEMVEEHLDTCVGVIVKCSNNGCPEKLQRWRILVHKFTCDYEPVSCKYAMVGCEERPPRKDIKKHENSMCPRRQHECPHCKETGEYQERTTTHLETCQQVRVSCPNVLCRVSIPRCEVSHHRSKCDYEPVPCKYAEVGCKDKLLRKDLEKHEENYQLHLQIITENGLVQKKEIEKLKNEVRRLQKEMLYLYFTFKVSSFDEKKKGQKRFFSSPFLSSKKGYKLCIRIDANGLGAGKGTHVSAYVYLMKGDNDDTLTWPFTGTVTFELLNQLEDKNHHKLSVSFTVDREAGQRVVAGETSANGWGYPKFITHADLAYKPDKNCQYLKDDTLFFQVSAQEPDFKPWLECM